MSHRVTTRARRQSQEREDSEEIDHTSSCSSAEADRRSALQDAKDSRLEERLIERRQNAIQLGQEEADALDAAQASADEAQAAADEADAAELEQEEEDAAYAERLAEEEAQEAQEVETLSRRNLIRDTIRANRDTAGTGQFLPTNILLPNLNLNLTSNSSTPTPVEVDEFTGTINLVDQVTRANSFLTKGNIERRITSASSIFFQQVVINFKAADIVALRLLDAQKHEVLNRMMSGSLVAAAKPAHSSNVNIMTTKSPPSFCGVITTAEVDKLVKYSNLLGTDQYVDLKSICDKAAISTIESHLSARGHLCGFTKPTDYERWLDWDHRKFADFMVILFGEDQTRVDKSNDLLTTIIKFNFGLNDNSRLGDIRNTHSEQRVLFQLSQHIENDFNPEHKTESGKMEVVRPIHRNLKPDSIIMLAMNKI
jgi:hypothetical protein